MGLWGFVFDEGTCCNSSFPVYFVFFKPMFHQKAKYQSSGAGVGQNCANMLALAMYISCLLFRFQLRLVPNVNPISSGIWALDFKA